MQDEPRDEICKACGWRFHGVVSDKGGPERSVPIGVYSTYDLGRANANAWLRFTSNAVRWVGAPIYEPMRDDEGWDSA